MATTLPDNAEDVVNSNRMRRALEGALAALKLFSTDVGARSQAIDELLREQPDEARLPAVEKAYAAETEAWLKERLSRLRAAILVSSPDKNKRLEAAQALAESRQPATRTLLLERLAKTAMPTPNPTPRCAPRCARRSTRCETRLAWGERLGAVFTGVSLGSILLLAALGLAITYGLMGVINMAHGELMMIGAYATYVVQNFFRSHLPAGAFDWYVVAAIPASFLAAGLVGAAMERSVIRWLYGRPLETLLATWGISLVLMQGVRSTLRRAERAGREPGLAQRRRAGDEQSHAALQPARDHRLRRDRAGRHLAARLPAPVSASSCAA